MQIDQLTVALRARNPWESFDLGVALARHTGINLYAAFVLPYLGFALLVNLAAWGHPAVAMLIVWWCKPVFDRIALQVLAQSVFGATPGWRATLVNWKQIPRTGLFHSLGIGRFDFARSFHLAVPQLEGQRGAARRERIAVLDKKARSYAVWLSIVVVHFAYVLLLGFDGLLKMISPDGVQFSLRLGDYFSFGANEPSLVSQYLFNAAFALAECVLEPLYVASGFSLYLSRRTALEGWDLEIAFKRMSARIAARAKPVAAALAVLLAVTLGVCPGTDVYAQSAGTEASVEKKRIAEVLRRAEFKQYEERNNWRPKNAAPTGDKPKAQPDLGFLVKLAQWIAEGMRVGLWIIAILFAGWLLYFLSRRLGWFKGLVSTRSGFKPDVLFGLDLRAASLPADIPAAAREALGRNDLRAALSLLYRGALRVLIHERELPLRAGDTEGDCVRHVNHALPGALAGYFHTLVEAWALLAYARRAPEAETVRQLVDEWTQHFVALTVGPAVVPAGSGTHGRTRTA